MTEAEAFVRLRFAGLTEKAAAACVKYAKEFTDIGVWLARAVRQIEEQPPETVRFVSDAWERASDR